MSIYRQRTKNASLIDAAKNRPCVDCGGMFPICCMEFDHVPGRGKKAMRGIKGSHVKWRVLEEIAKCDVVCANCHKIRTFTRAGWI